MNWMFESRSKNWYDDDSEGASYTPWYLELLTPILAIPAGIIFVLLLIPWLLFIIVHIFREIVKETAESGKLNFPGLTFMGLAATIVLPLLIVTDLFHVLDHPFIVLCSTLFILLFTVAPFTGLVLSFFKPNKDNWGA